MAKSRNPLFDDEPASSIELDEGKTVQAGETLPDLPDHTPEAAERPWLLDGTVEQRRPVQEPISESMIQRRARARHERDERYRYVRETTERFQAIPGSLRDRIEQAHRERHRVTFGNQFAAGIAEILRSGDDRSRKLANHLDSDT